MRPFGADLGNRPREPPQSHRYLTLRRITERLPGRDQIQPGSSIEDAVVRDGRKLESDRSSCDPAITIVHFARESVSDPLALVSKLSAPCRELVVPLDGSELGNSPFEATAPQLAPIGTKRPIPELHDCLEGEDYGSVCDDLTVTLGQRVRSFVEQPADHHCVDDDARRKGVRHVSASASWKAAHSSSGTSSMMSFSRGGSGRARLSASSGG